ncbi:PPC domain-containing protein [Armatimonas sp.]|uniref:PPC domain-containing protein n=1 Tax=Armatimonas sp. TaxID=1872638 RepID=UPI003753442B
MRTFLIAFVALFGAVLPSFAQGGFGGGSFGGGMGMTTGRRGGSGDVTKAVSILTPGQFTEYPLTVKAAGETLIAEVDTTNFDSALQIVDSAGKVLAENDDRREGEQDARLLYRFPAAGAYKLLVRAFKGAAGGQFDLLLRRFTPQELVMGSRAAHAGHLTAPTYFQVALTEPQTLLIQLSGASNPELTIFDPTGEPVAANSRFGDRNRLELRTKVKGSYFLRLETVQPCGIVLDAARVLTHTLAQKSEPQGLKAGGLDLWRFQGKMGQLVRLSTLGEGVALSTNLELMVPDGMPIEEREALAARGLARLSVPAKAIGEQVVVLNRDGLYELAIAQPQAQPVRYTLSSTATVRRWDVLAPLKETLPLGKAEFFQLTGKAGEILLLEGHSEQFDIALELFNEQGTLVASNDDNGSGTERNARIRSLLTANGAYFLRVHAFGDGGSGNYELRRTTTPLRPLSIGGRQEGTLETSSPLIFSFTGKPGQALLLSARSTDCDTLVRVYGPDGTLVGTDDDNGGGSNSLLAFTPVREGTYTIWLSSKVGAGKVTVRLIEAD